MSERKVLNKYYPPDYDPSKVPRVKRKNKQNDVRTMAPFNMRCNTCGNYIAHSTKFNAKKEEVEDATYNTIKIFRFYIKCPRCMATIIYRTNPKEKSYEVEVGATENFMALKMAERQARDEAEASIEEEKIDPMKQLENRTKASRQQMEASDQIQSLRSIRHRMHSIDIDTVIHNKRQEISEETTLSISDGHEDDDIRAEARRLLKRKAIECGGASSSVDDKSTQKKIDPPTTTVGTKKLSSSLLSLKKKIKIAPKVA